jgi:hypothetical protein
MPYNGRQEANKSSTTCKPPASKKLKIVSAGAVPKEVLVRELNVRTASTVAGQEGCTMRMNEEDFIDSQESGHYEEDVFDTMTGKHVSSTPCSSSARPSSSSARPSSSSASSKTPSAGGLRLSASSTASSFTSSSSTASADADGKKELEFPCYLPRTDTLLDSAVLPVIMARVSMLPKIAGLRQSKWVLVAGEGGSIRICVNDLRDVIVHLLFGRILLDMNEKNPVDNILKSLNKTGEFVAGRSLICDNYYNFLDALSTNLIKMTIQRIHEHLKYSFRDPWHYLESRGCVKPRTYLSWLDPTSVGVLRKATQDWTPKNTFIDQQIAANQEYCLKGVFTLLKFYIIM